MENNIYYLKQDLTNDDMKLIIGCLLGIILGVNAPVIPYSISGYVAISIIMMLISIIIF